MEKARQAVSEFVSHGGKHKTSVDESVAPAVTSEHVKPHHHENLTTAIDREVHQDHHHTTVQPIHHKEVLPEEHSHHMIPVEHKSFEHGKESDVRSKLEMEAAKFKNTSVKHDTTRSQNVAPTVEAERVHHHVHEHVQPVIEKETVQPKVVHTTVPIHETHHAAAQHHGISTLPAKTLDEFKTAGGLLDGKGSTHHGEYDGCPRPYNKGLQTEQTEADRNMHQHSHGIGHHHDSNGVNGVNGINGTSGGHTGTSGTGINGDSARTGSTGLGNNTGNSTGTTNSTATGTSTGKPSLAARLNPLKDTDHDGKRGIMD